jgi:hypothetical protein
MSQYHPALQLAVQSQNRPLRVVTDDRLLCFLRQQGWPTSTVSWSLFFTKQNPMITLKKRIVWVDVARFLLVCSCLLLLGCEQHQKSSERENLERGSKSTLTDLHVLESAYQNHQHNLPVTQQGTIIRILPDDTEGTRHQRCIVELASGQSVLIAHNIDIAPRLPDLTTGTTLIFHGEYEWNKNGGTIHWTHHDPQGHHEAGWLIYEGKTYK